MSDKLVTRLVKLQRAAPVRAFVGPNGGGKTASAVASILPSLVRGRLVYSNVRLFDFEHLRPCEDPECACDKNDPGRHFHAHENYRPLTSWRQVVNARKADILFDEISSWMSSRDTAGLPGEVETFLQQPRKPDVTFTYTCPAWGRADKVLRQVTRQVIYCRDVKRFRKTNDDGDRIWFEGRLFRQAGYDAQELEKFENGKREDLPSIYQGHWWGPGSIRFRAYDTYEYVPLMGARAQRGPCLDCGLRRGGTAGTCQGHDNEETGGYAPARALGLKVIANIETAPAGTGATPQTEAQKMRPSVTVHDSLNGTR